MAALIRLASLSQPSLLNSASDKSSSFEIDSKTFVDRPLKANPKVILKEFDKEFGKLPIDKIDVQKLVNFRKRFLVIKIDNPKQNSLIEVPHPFIVPGGRFREFYYWDAYWIVKGLIASDLFETHLLENGFSAPLFGFVPNGGRVYYLRRSQPPFLIPMVYEYYEATRDAKFIKENFNHLVKEYEFWVQKRAVKIKDKNGYEHSAYQYRTTSNVPRPESFLVDVEDALKIREKDRQQFFQNVASAAESGWDFSSRWFRDRKQCKPLKQLIFYLTLRNMKKLFTTGNEKKTEEFEKKGRSACKTLNAIFYNETEKAWFDYNLRTRSHNVMFYSAAMMPLFTGCYTTLDYDKSAKVIDFMNQTLDYQKQKIQQIDKNSDSNAITRFNYPNGIPASLKILDNNGTCLNGWPPLQHIIIEGMRKSDNPDTQEMAFKLARKWILANYKVYETTKKMWEKIDVTGAIPKPGVGGEYDVQDGFGWTNGVILDLLVNYYDRMTIADTEEKISSKPRISAISCRSNIYRVDYNTIIIITLHAI
ncbi:Trehalase, partial [Dirofilaria immitis]|nr:Trehalase [Dirofilaria immitis]